MSMGERMYVYVMLIFFGQSECVERIGLKSWWRVCWLRYPWQHSTKWMGKEYNFKQNKQLQVPCTVYIYIYLYTFWKFYIPVKRYIYIYIFYIFLYLYIYIYLYIFICIRNPYAPQSLMWLRISVHSAIWTGEVTIVFVFPFAAVIGAAKRQIGWSGCIESFTKTTKW